MRDHYVRVAAAVPKVTVADPEANRAAIEEQMKACAGAGVKIAVFPELCLSGYTCEDLFLQTSLVREAKASLTRLMRASEALDCLYVVGLPWEERGRLYNCMAVLFHGELLGLIPKSFIPNYGEFYEARHFGAGWREPEPVIYKKPDGGWGAAWMGTDLLFVCEEFPELVVGAEVCEDVWAPDSPSIRHALAGATVIVNGSASDETTGKSDYRKSLISLQSAKCLCAYVYASAGDGESTTDLVFSGHSLIAEDGTILGESPRFSSGIMTAEVDLDRLVVERRRMGTFGSDRGKGYQTVFFSFRETPDLTLKRRIDPAPFVPDEESARRKRCEEILMIQASGLKSRMEKIGASRAVVGVSGGLDSTLALLVTAKAFDLLGLPKEQILAVTMPCFGTTDRTYANACRMARVLGAELKEVNIKKAVTQHFADIGHETDKLDVTYENSQARERTQVLMDLANQSGGLVIGTGDMSELALGWATYNGDHMSMYGVNASVPKTLVRHLVAYYADTCEEEELSRVLRDVLDTPVSPELLPPEDGKIAQKTEDLVGPYELHDFFLYYMLRYGYRPGKIYRLAGLAFAGRYEEAVILRWMKTFYRRFFAQQFKRSCLPDGPKVGSVAMSPRGDLRMPSDAGARLWLSELEAICPEFKKE
ncbi:MAG: NAD(+) synthase [Lachnospiraceae bacterium]|nr:NAD(+) synthase [Lachnospiraceae bacterium]